MCVIKHKGKEVGKIPACAVNAEAYINELASHYGDLNIEYVYDANAAFLAAMHGGVRRDIPKIDSNNEEEETTSLQEASLKKKIPKNVKVSDDPKLVRKYNDIIKWFNASRAKQAKQAGKKAPAPLPLAQLIKPSQLAATTKPTSKLGKLIQKAREKGPTGGKMGSKLTAPSIYKMRVGKARGKAPSPKSVAVKTIEPTIPYVPFEPKWKEPKIDIIRAPEQPAVPITQPTKLLAPPAQPKLLAPPSDATQPTAAPTPKVIAPPPETLPDTTPQITKDYNDTTHYFDLNTTKQYEIERRARDETAIEKRNFQTTNPEMVERLSKYIEIRNKRLEEWRKKLKNEVISLIEGLPMHKMILFSSASRRTNVFIRKAMKLGTMHYGIIDVGSETRWVDRLEFYGETATPQKDLLRREPAPMPYYVPPEARKFKHEKLYEIDKLIYRMIGVTDRPALGLFALDKALVKYKFLDKSIFGFKDEEPFTRTWDPSKGGRPLEELREVIRERIAEKLLFEYIHSSAK